MSDFDADLGRDIDLERAAYAAEDSRFLVSGPLADDAACCRWHAAGGTGAACLILSPAELHAATGVEHDEDVEGALAEVRRG